MVRISPLANPLPLTTSLADEGETLPRVRLAVLGAGYWGPNIVRNLLQNPQCDLHAICDLDSAKLDHVAEQQLPQGHTVHLTTDFNDLLDDPLLDGIAIITEIPSHFPLAAQALQAGKHVFVEKPLALSAGQCRQLGEIARRKQKTLMVGHTFIYNPAVDKLKQIAVSGELGDIYYLHAQRLNLGRAQTHVNALWSLAVHDITIALHLFEEMPTEVRCWGQSFITPEIEDVVFVNLQFPSGRMAQIHASWLDPEKRRQVTLVGNQKMVVYDDVSLDRKIAVYDKGIQKSPLLNIQHPEYNDFSGFQLLTRTGDVVIPQLKFDEPLKIEMQHFIDCILGKVDKPITGWEEGQNTVQVLEAAQRSLKQAGMPVPLT